MTESVIESAGLSDGDVLVIRGERVILDARVADAFGTETRRVNDAVARNAARFGPSHVFQLTTEEAEASRSQTATPIGGQGGGRGGPRYRPHVFTLKGIARLATVLTTPSALQATDLIIDTFLTVQDQLRQGRRRIAIPEPDRYQPSPDQRQAVARLRTRLADQLSRLLDVIVDVERQQSVRQVAQSLGGGALHAVQERLRSKGLENAKLEADTALVLAQAEKVLAEARKTSAEADGTDIGNVERRITAVSRIAGLIREIEPDGLFRLLESFNSE